MNELASWLVPITLTGLVGAVIWIVRLAMVITILQKDNESQSKEIDGLGQRIADHETWDRAQHKELFDSRNKDAVTLERLTTLFEGMDAKIDEILLRERARNGIH